MKKLYRIFDLNIKSCIDFHGCQTIKGIPDVIVEYGNIPENIDGFFLSGGRIEIKPGKMIFNVKNKVRYLVEKGKKVTIELQSNFSEKEILYFLAGTVWAGLLFQRGLFPIHGSAVNCNGKGVLFIGKGGAGKSTLGGLFHEKGYKLLADDLCGTFFDENGKLVILPGFQWQKLSEVSLRLLNKYNDTPLEKVKSRNMQKYFFKRDFLKNPLVIDQIYYLSKEETDEFSINELGGAASFNSIINNSFRLKLVKGFCLEKEHLNFCRQVCNRVAIYKITHPPGSFFTDSIIGFVKKKSGIV